MKRVDVTVRRRTAYMLFFDAAQLGEQPGRWMRRTRFSKETDFASVRR